MENYIIRSSNLFLNHFTLMQLYQYRRSTRSCLFVWNGTTSDVIDAQKATKARGILLVFSNGRTALLGAGKPVEYGAEPSTDLNFDEWTVYSKHDVIESAEDQPGLKLYRDSLLVSYHESASGLFYWLHGKAHWYQQGD